MRLVSRILQIAVACLAFALTTAAPIKWLPSVWWPWRALRACPDDGNHVNPGFNVQVGPRPYYLVDNMTPSPLKYKLEGCKEQPKSTSSFSMAHLGAPLMFPEHSRQGYEAAIRMGAGIIECDVSFTSDHELVCRRSNCDLHYTTDILARPDLAAKCTRPFKPYDAAQNKHASAKCCTSDITLTEFKSLCAEMEATAFNAVNVMEDMGRIGTTSDWRTDLYAYSCAETMSLKDQIALVNNYGLNFTVEAKTPEIPMPFGSYTQQDFAQQIVDTFKEVGISPDRVWLQSFLQHDVFYWIANASAFGTQAMYLDNRADSSPKDYRKAVASLPSLAKRGVKIIAPSIWQLITVDNTTGTIVPSTYAKAAHEAGLEIIPWSFERSVPLNIAGGGYYYKSVANLIKRDGDEFTVIDVIAQQVKASRIFSDWPGTVTYYANCFGLK